MNRAPGNSWMLAGVGLALWVLLTGLPVLAQSGPWGPPGAIPTQPQWYGMPQQGYPGGAGWPYGQAPGAAPAQQAPTTPPSVKIKLEATQAYVHQGLVAVVEIISDDNLDTLSIEMPHSDAVIFREIGTPSARAETRGGRRRIINERQYHMIPMRPGQQDLGVIKVSGELSGGRPFETATAAHLVLQIEPPDDRVRPWLPLHQLALSARLQDDDLVDEGRPLTLIIEQQAVGMAGAQLPSLEKQLKSEHHQLYRESTAFEASISDDNRLIGKRTDRFTLVPQRRGEMVIPEISLSWWNVDKRRKEVSIIPARHLLVAGEVGSSRRIPGVSDILFFATDIDPRLYWVVLIAVGFVAGLSWRRIWNGLRELDDRLFRGFLGRALVRTRRAAGERVVVAVEPVREVWQETAGKVSLRRCPQIARHYLADLLPRSLRLWFCVRVAAIEPDPEDWTTVFRFLLEKRLGISAHKPMAPLAAQLADMHPGSDPERLAALLHQLESSLFSPRPMTDFETWKRDFTHQIRPRPWRALRARLTRKGGGKLPALNPDPGV